jgi:hypothetical protein
MTLASIVWKDLQPMFNTWQVCQEPKSTIEEEDPFVSSIVESPKWISDTGASGRRYLNQDTADLWQKSVGVLVGTPTISLVANAVEAVFKVIKVVTFANFWMDREIIPASKNPSKHVLFGTLKSGRTLCFADFLPTNKLMGEGIGYTLAHAKEKMNAAWAKPLLARIDEEHPYDFKARLLDTLDDLYFIVKLVPSLAARTLCALGGVVLGTFSSTRTRDCAKLYATFERWQGASFMLAPCFQPEATHHGLGGNINEPNAW